MSGSVSGGLRRICQVVSNPHHPSEEWFIYRDVMAVVLPSREPVEVAAQVLEALVDERRQTQRAMIAALYWRAGEHQAECERATRAAPECMATASSVLEYALREHRNHMATWRAASDMEAAL